jgi:predicted flap endonuclease-1-like 5' DNA nuclease
MKPRNVLLAFAVIFLCSIAAFAQPKKLSDIEGIGPAYQQKLEAAGIKTPAQLYDAAAASKDRAKLAEKSGISATLLLKWVNRYDLARVKGIGTQYADLLEVAGVDSPKELARRNADNLLEALTKTNTEKKLVRKLPTKAQVEEWIKNAKSVTSKVEG